MHHTTTVGPVMDEDGKALPYKSFHVKGLLESNNPTELLTDAEFAALTVENAEFTRTSAGGFEYSFEIVVDQSKLSRVLAESARAAKAAIEKAAADTAVQQKSQHDAMLKQAYEQGKRDAELAAAKAAGAASVKDIPPSVQ